MHGKRTLATLIVASALLVAGCDKSTESGSIRLNVHPSLGNIQDAKVWVYKSDGKTRIAKGETGTTGVVGLYPTLYTGPVVIRVLSDEDTFYFDESLGTFVTLPAGRTMFALAPSATGNYGVTPLTDLAYRIAVDQGLFPLSSTEVNRLNERVREALAPELRDITLPPTILSEMPDCAGNPDSCLQDTQEDRYALRLAALARLGDGQSRPALSVMQALARDVLDEVTGVDIDNDTVDDADGFGVINSYDKQGTAFATPYDPLTMVDDLNQALTDLADLHGTPELQLAVASDAEYPDASLVLDLTAIDDGSNYSGCDGGDSTLPDNFRGRSYNLRFQQSDITSPYKDGNVVRFTFCTDGQLRESLDYRVVANGYTETVIDAIQTNYRWTKASNGVRYEVVSMNGTFFELNVYGSGGSPYFGRFIR